MLGLSALVAVLALLGPGSAPASAHSELVSSNPEDGAVLTAAPDRVVLTFSEDIRDQGSAVVVTGSDKARVDDPDSLVISGPRVSLSVDDTVGSGDYAVAYRVVSADGHVIGGAVTYRVELPAQETSAPTSSPSPTATPTSTPTASPTASPSPDPASSADDGSTALWLAVALGTAALAATAFVVARARRNRG